jgi:sn-glycerol 3-phosphate transport system ATP-binding protein
MLGAERLVYGRIADSLFTVRVDGTLAPPKVGDVMALRMDPKHLHWFDPVTLHRVE